MLRSSRAPPRQGTPSLSRPIKKGTQGLASIATTAILALMTANVALFVVMFVTSASNGDGPARSVVSVSSSLRRTATEQKKIKVRTRTTTTPKTSRTTGTTRKYPIVDCPSLLRTFVLEGVYDPNVGLDGKKMVYKRFTTTEPPFWISLHNRYFDRLRWFSIMDKGDYYEKGVTDQFKRILNATDAPGLVVDVGMNIGWFSLLARTHGHRVAGFEPNPVMHARVCESLALNLWNESEPAIEIFPYGLGAQEATLNLTTGSNPGHSSFYEERLAPKHRKRTAVRVVTLDGVAAEEGWLSTKSPPIHLMKVDVEGYEPVVFAGGNALLASGKVRNIIMENSAPDLRKLIDLMARLAGAGYRLHYLSDVNGEAYHPEWVPEINEELESVSAGMDLQDVGVRLTFFSKQTCNLWMTKNK